MVRDMAKIYYVKTTQGKTIVYTPVCSNCIKPGDALELVDDVDYFRYQCDRCKDIIGSDGSKGEQ